MGPFSRDYGIYNIISLQKDKDYFNYHGLPQLHSPCPMTVVVVACVIR